MAIKKTIKIDVDAKQAIKSLDELGGSFEDANGEGAIPLSTIIGELEDRLYAMAVAGDTASDEFKEISAQVGKMKKVIVETDLEIDGLSQTMSQNVGGALQGVASGFELAQGAMGAFGAGGEAVEEALLKVQSAMAMAQGLQGLRESIASFKALRKAVMANVIVQKLLNFVMNLNPIGMIILAVVALGAAIALLWSPIKKLAQFFGLAAEEAETAAEATKKLNATMEAQSKILERLRNQSAKNHEMKMRQLELEDASEEEKHNERLKRLKKEDKERKQELQSLVGNLDNQQRLYKKSKRTEDFENARSVKTQIETNKARIIELRQANGEYDQARKEEIKKFNQFEKDEAQKVVDDENDRLKERNDNYKNFLAERKDARRAIEDLENELEDDAIRQAVNKRRTEFERELEDLKGNAQEKARLTELLTQQFEEDMREIRKSFREKDVELLKLDTDIKIGEQNREHDNWVTNREKQTEIDKRAVADDLVRAEAVKDARYQISKDGFQLIANLSELFANRSEKAARAAFNIQKAASIAQATISGIEATINAFKTASASPVTIGFPAFPFIQAGIAGAFAATNIAKIASSQFGGGAGGGIGSSPSLPSGGAGGGNVANFNVVGNTGLNQLAETLGSQDQAPVKAFVVGSDVTTQQSLDRNKVETATL